MGAPSSMSSSRADRRLTPAAAAAMLLVLLTACGTSANDAPPSRAAPTPSAAGSPTGLSTSSAASPDTGDDRPPDRITEAIDRALTLRTAAVPAPSTVTLSVLARTIRLEGGDGYRAVAVGTSQIAGFDELPVAIRRVFHFRLDRDNPGELVVVGAAEPWNGRITGDFLEPWETMRVVLRRSHGVLGVFDVGSAPSANAVMRSAKAALVEVGTSVPYAWSRNVVVYALSTPTFLAGLPDVPGGDPLVLDAVSFPVRSGDGRLAGTRIALHPRTLGSGPEIRRSRDRLLRHEMVHVAVGEHDDRAPLWLSEGIAEYLSVRSLAPEDRTLSRAAVRAAQVGLPGLPADDAFTGPAHEASYGISWWACEALVASYGELALWQLLDAYAAASSGAGTVLADTLGIDEPALAAKAGRLMLAHYGRD
jgi:hypothetical protein